MSALGQTSFTVPTGRTGRTLELRRLPEHHDPSLRAWDAADEYALAHLFDHEAISGLEHADSRRASQPTGQRDSQPNTVVINDLFGALAVALSAHRVQSWGDSITSHRATEANLAANGLLEGDPGATDRPVRFVSSVDVPDGPIDLAIIKVPRSLALLDDQLRRLAPLLRPNATVIGAGMTKTVHTSTIACFERHIGPSPTTPARKKARLILAEVDPSLVGDPRPKVATITTALANGRPVVDFPNVFSRGKLDRGTRLLLDYLESHDDGQRDQHPSETRRGAGGVADIGDQADLLDLGCGNGILGLTLAQHAPRGRVTFVDESYQAVASARATAKAWGLPIEQRFLTDHTLEAIAEKSIDVVVNNPPFHAHQSRTDTTARQMFDDAQRVLRPEGKLLVVGNRHLGYHRELQRRFRSVATVASNPKFVVLEAQNPKPAGAKPSHASPPGATLTNGPAR